MTLPSIILGLILMWLFVLSFFLYKTRSHYLKLTKKTHSATLETALEKLLNNIDHHKEDIAELQKEVHKLGENARHHYQKMGFVRFNPFDRIGGDQSFVIALLDEEDTGIVLNFLYTREGVRVYAKPVKEGNGIEFELAKEEIDAIKHAR